MPGRENESQLLFNIEYITLTSANECFFFMWWIFGAQGKDGVLN